MRAACAGGAAARLFLLAIAFGVSAGIVPTRPPAPHFASQLERDAFTATELHADAMESLRSGVPVSGTLWRFERAVRLSENDQIYHPVRLPLHFYDWWLGLLYDEIYRFRGKHPSLKRFLEGEVYFIGRKTAVRLPPQT